MAANILDPQGRDINLFEGHLPFCKALNALSILASCRSLFCNMDLLGEAGVSAPPATWDEVLTACQAVKDKFGDSIVPWGLDISTDGLLLLQLELRRRLPGRQRQLGFEQRRQREGRRVHQDPD